MTSPDNNNPAGLRFWDGCDRAVTRPNVGTAVSQCVFVIREPSSMRLFSDCMRTERFQVRNFINGEFVEPISGQYLDNVEPATGKPYSQVADSDATRR